MFLDIWNLTNGYVYVTRSRGRLPVVKIQVNPANERPCQDKPAPPSACFYSKANSISHSLLYPNVVSDRACNETLCSTGCQARCAGK